MTNAAHLLSRLAFLVFGTLALVAGLATITTTQASAAPSTPIIEPGIPHNHECVLQTRTKAYRVVADTDPRCLAWWGPDRNGPVPTVAPFDPNVKPAAKHHAPKRVQHHAPKRAQKVRTIVVVPDLSTIQTTPVVCRMEQGPADGLFRWETCTPEESPNGGHVTAIYEDGSARYSDGYTIAPKKDVKPGTSGAVLGKWKAPKAPRAQHA